MVLLYLHITVCNIKIKKHKKCFNIFKFFRRILTIFHYHPTPQMAAVMISQTSQRSRKRNVITACGSGIAERPATSGGLVNSARFATKTFDRPPSITTLKFLCFYALCDKYLYILIRSVCVNSNLDINQNYVNVAELNFILIMYCITANVHYYKEIK